MTDLWEQQEEEREEERGEAANNAGKWQEIKHEELEVNTKRDEDVKNEGQRRTRGRLPLFY